MRYILIVLFVLSGLVASAQLPSNTFNSRWFTGNTRTEWIIMDSPLVNKVMDTFYARYPGTQIVRIQGGDTAFWFYGGNRRWFRGLQATDTVSLSNRINLKLSISDTAAMLSPYLRKIDTTNKWVQDVYVRNDSLFKYKNGTETFLDTLGNGSAGSGLTSVGLSLPSAFTVTNSPLTSNGTLNVIGAGTTLQYIRGDGTLATTDSGMIPNFYLKVRGLLTGSSPITFNQTTGAIGINNANASGTKGAASFTGSFSDNGSGLIDLLDLVAAGSCTGCNLNIDAKGRITGYSDGAGGATDNVNIGSSFRWLNAGTQQIRTVASSNTIGWDSVSTANTLTAKADTSVLATQYDLTQLSFPSLANSGLSKSGDTIQLGSTNTTNNPLNHNTWINTSTFSFVFNGSHPTGDVLEVANSVGGGLRGSGINSYGVAGTSTNLYGVYGTSTTSHAIQGWTTNGNTAGYLENTASSTNTVTPTLQIKRTTEGTAGAGIGSSIEYYIEKDNGANNTPSHTLRSILTDPANGNEDGQFELYGVNNASLARRFAISSVGQWTWDGYPALTQQTDTTNIKPIGYNTTTGLIQPMANWIGSGGGAGTVTQVNTGYGLSGGPITTTGTLLVDTSLIVTQFDLSLQPKVYNVTDPKFGAIGDGKKVFDAAISASTTTLTSATANFTSSDVGKAIRVPYAGAAGVDLITTIAAFTNSTTITLTDAASTTVTADTVVWGSDNTTAFQNALDTCHHYGGGKIWVPNGVYMFAGQLRNNVNGTSPNSQIILPATFFGGGGDSTFNYRTSIVIEGETGPEWTPNLLFDDSTVGWRGVILYSLINGTGNAPALFGTKSRLQASDSLNYSAYEFRNLTILVSKNLNGGGPSIGGINCYYCGVSTGDNVMVTIDGSAAKSTRPTNNVAGIITNKIFSETMTRWVNTHVAGFKYGVCVSDHANLDQVEVYFCDKAFVFMHNVETIQANRILAQWNISSLFIPDATIMGLQNSFGASYFKIDNLQIEVWNGDAPASGWYNYTYIVDDAANQGVGELTHLTDEAGCCVNNALFNKNGGTGIITKQLGAYEDNAWVMVNSVDLANRNTGNIGIGVNPTATLHVQKSQAGFTEIRAQNPNAAGQVGFQAVNDASLSGGIRMKGSGVGAYGAYVDNSTAYYSNATGGMALMLDANADITLSCGAGGPPPVRMRVAGSTGAITFNNAYTFPTANGTDGYVLTAHTGGVATWDAPTGGSGTVTSFAFTDGGGFDGTVTNPTTTPTLSIIPSFSGLVASESSALGAATIGNLLEYNSGTIQFNDAYMTSIPNTQIFLKSRMQRLSFDVADANFTTLSTRQEGFFKLPEITANRTFSMFSGTGVDGVELYIYNLNTSGTFSWSFTGITPEKASDGSSVSAIANGVLYHILGMYDGTNAHWIIVNQ
jgi:hypothetical protein